MNKFIQTVTLALVGLYLAGSAVAAALTVQIETPASPTSLTDIKIAFVALDYASNGSITAKCYYKKGDGAYTQLGGDIGIATGGGSFTCNTTSDQINGEGTYTFYVQVTNSSETVSSNEVSVTYTNSEPGTPTNYGKAKVNSCDYKISFRTADDGGKTVKVEVYRSENSSFTADAGTRVDTVTIGSNTDGSSTTTAPDCNKDYFFAVRAFDSAGRGSGLVGDSVTVTTGSTTVTTASGTSGAVGAIPVSGSVLGTSRGASGSPTGSTGAILGEEATDSSEPTPEVVQMATKSSTARNIGLGVLAVAVILFIAWLLKRKSAA